MDLSSFLDVLRKLGLVSNLLVGLDDTDTVEFGFGDVARESFARAASLPFQLADNKDRLVDETA